MATVTTTSVTNPLRYPGTTFIDYQIHLPPSGAATGYLYVLVQASTANTYEIWRTVTGGASWVLFSSFVRASIVEMGSMHIDAAGWLHVVYRTNESGEDRIYYRRMDSVGTFTAEILVTSYPNGGVAGAIYQGMDFMTANDPVGHQRGVVAVGTNISGKYALSLYGILALAGFNPTVNNGVLAGNRQVLLGTGTGRVGVSIDLEHVGNGKGAGVPNLWVVFGRTSFNVLKLAWNGGGWVIPTAPANISGTITAKDYVPGLWDGDSFLVVRTTGTSQPTLYERNRANTSTVTRSTPVHTDGVVRSVGLSYNSITRDPRVFAVGTSTNDLYYVDFIRATGTWSGWLVVTTTDITGSGVDNFSPRRGSAFNSKIDILTAHSGVTIAHAALSLAYPPLTPSWSFSAVPYTHGSAADVATALLLDWTFNDPDPNDVQKDYALSRTIGTDTIEYWQASNGTWQPAEVKNATATTQVSLPAGLFVDRFTTGVSGWTPTSCTFATTSVRFRSAPGAALLTVTGSPAQAFARTANIAVSATTSYSAELWGLSVAGYSDFGVAIDWYTSGSVYISTSTSGGSALAANVWGRRSVTATSPGTAAFAQIGPTLGSTPTGQVAYVDDVSFGATPTPWGAASDAAHTYRVKTWDSADVASSYSAALTLVPSAKVNPTITAPLDSSTYASPALTVTWTVAEQTAYQVQLLIFGVVLTDSGKVVSSSTSYVVPYDLINGFNFSIILWTWNNEGLQSSAVQSNFAVSFVAPATPTHVATPDPANGYITVQITNPAAAAVVATGTVAHGNNASVTPGLPAGMAAGDAMFCLSAIRNSGTGVPTLPAGYTSTIALFGNVGLFAKVHTGSESAPLCAYTGGVANADTSAQIVAFRRAGITLIGAPATLLNATSQNILYPALTVSTVGCIVFYIGWKQDDQTSSTTPAGFTKIGDLSTTTGDDQSITWGYQIQTAATNISSGTITVSGGLTAISRAILVAVSGIPAVTYNDVYRLATGAPLTEGVRVGQGIAVNGSVNDFRASARKDWSYRVLAVGENGSTGVGLWAP